MRKGFALLFLFFYSCGNSPSEQNNSVDTPNPSSNELIYSNSPVYSQEQIDSINNSKISTLINRQLIYHGWKTTEHSSPEDIQDRGLGNLVVRTSPSEEDSDISIKLNKNNTYSVTFNPIHCQEKITKTGTWKWNDNSAIELDKNVFAAVKVICMDFPGADPLDEYIYISKLVNIEDGHIVLDVRETKRCSFFAHMAIVNQDDEKKVDEEKYAYSALHQLSLGTDLITQYIQYLK